MGIKLFDDLKKLTQPVEEEEDFFPGAKVEEKPVKTPAPAPAAPAQEEAEKEFEKFGSRNEAPVPETEEAPEASSSGRLFGNLGLKKAVRAPKMKAETDYSAASGSADSQVVILSPKSFDEAGQIVSYLQRGLTICLNLEGTSLEASRRILDFISGVVFAMNAKITTVSGKTFFITPHNVDILDSTNN